MRDGSRKPIMDALLSSYFYAWLVCNFNWCPQGTTQNSPQHCPSKEEKILHLLNALEVRKTLKFCQYA